MNNINKKINSINPNLDNENSLGYNSERIKIESLIISNERNQLLIKMIFLSHEILN